MFNTTALMYAASGYGTEEIIKLLLAKEGIDTNIRDVLILQYLSYSNLSF